MKEPDFNFKKHQNHHKSWKMLIRFIVYGIIISLLLYFMLYKDETTENSKKETIDAFDIDVTAQPSE